MKEPGQLLADRIAIAVGALTLPISALLFAQWPLRDLLGRWAYQANDLAQCLFALYVAVAVAHAGRRGVHLVARPDIAPNLAASDAPGLLRRCLGLAQAMVLFAWAAAVLWAALPGAWRSAAALEAFPESGTPGYFIVKLALVLLALMLAWQAVSMAWALRRQRGDHGLPR